MKRTVKTSNLDARTFLFRNSDGDAKPFITQKDVVLCRSGVQLYSRAELDKFIRQCPPPYSIEGKTIFREYRPANVIVKAKELCKSLPVTKEHPSVWVDSANWKDLAGGTTDREVEVVALDGESEGEIGLKSSLTFYDKDLYTYYSENNKEVSLGYNCVKQWVENPEEAGFDIVVTEISEVNHLAITRAGRGGTSVAVVDSLIGGLKPMRTGIFSFLNKKKGAALASFGSLLFTALEGTDVTNKDSLEKGVQSVLDSCEILADSEKKTTLMNVVRDCFDNKDRAIQNKSDLVTTLDSLYNSAMDCGSIGVDDSKDDKDKKDEKGKEEKEEKNKDSEKQDKDDKNKDANSKPADNKDSNTAPAGNKDSNVANLDADALKTTVLDSIKASLQPMVVSAVKDALGIKDDTPAQQATGANLDSNDAIPQTDYASFLDF